MCIRDRILTLTAHYDSVPEGPGAYDNMSGAAIIMELCRYFHAHRPRRTMAVSYTHLDVYKRQERCCCKAVISEN